MVLDFVPSWTKEGVISPVNDDGASGSVSRERSPYEVTFKSFASHFATSQERKAILKGFLSFRRKIYSVGIVSGFQWVDGSFVENVEQLESRSPGDVDVVTFFDLPNQTVWEKFKENFAEFFHPENSKKKFLVDAYYVQLNDRDPYSLVRDAAYWYSMWAHRRSRQWKGFLQIPLSQEEDRQIAEDVFLFERCAGREGEL